VNQPTVSRPVAARGIFGAGGLTGGPRVALDLLGGDHGPEAAVEGAMIAVQRRPDLRVALVGPPEPLARLLAPGGQAHSGQAHGRQAHGGRADQGRLALVAARESVAATDGPGGAVRARRDTSLEVAARLVRDGQVDAMVRAGPAGAALAAAVFSLPRLPGVTRPSLALVVPAPAGPVVLVDIGANLDCGPGLLAEFALAGAAYARVRLRVPNPRVGLLSAGPGPGGADELRRRAAGLLAELPLDFTGTVEGHDVAVGGRADVVVTDGFTGDVLLKGMEGAVAAVARAAAAGLDGGDQRAGSARYLLPVLAQVADTFSPEEQGGAMLLGAQGVVVIGHGASTPRAVAAGIETAAEAVTEGLVPGVRAALGDLAARRRAGTLAWPDEAPPTLQPTREPTREPDEGTSP
jgi:glycerol-3-phosphate acyltransferase PlsX